MNYAEHDYDCLTWNDILFDHKTVHELEWIWTWNEFVINLWTTIKKLNFGMYLFEIVQKKKILNGKKNCMDYVLYWAITIPLTL